MTDNDPKVLVELSPAEVAWLSDRLHEMCQGWSAAALMKDMEIQQRGEASQRERDMILALEEHKRMEAAIRNRILNKAAEQGFGDL